MAYYASTGFAQVYSVRMTDDTRRANRAFTIPFAEWAVYDPFNALFRPQHNGYMIHDGVVAFTDGACRNNGYSNAAAGFGVYFGPGSAWNVSARVPEHEKQSNNVAELMAVERALDFIYNRFRNVTKRLVIASDSEYVVDGLCNDIFNWQRNGWRTYGNRGQVLNKEIWMDIQKLTCKLEDEGCIVQFARVPRDWVEPADRLARAALN